MADIGHIKEFSSLNLSKHRSVINAFVHLAIHQFSRAAQRGGSGRQDRTILTMRRRPLVNQEVRLRATFLG
jgi:hypothetical protein